jgi:hypothetical protein
LATFALAYAAASLNYTNSPEVVSHGGGRATSTAYVLEGSIGDAAVGLISSVGYINASGFPSTVPPGGGGTVVVLDPFTAPNGPPPGWSSVSGSWAINANTLEHALGAAGRESIRSDGPSVANAWIEFSVTVPSGTPTVSLVFRASDPSLDGLNQYWAQLDYAAGVVRILKDVLGAETVVASVPFALATGTAYTVRVKFAADDIRVLVNGAQQLCVTDTSLLQTGSYGLQVEGGSLALFDNFSVVVAANSLPVANAGPDQTLTGSQSILLNGTASSDADGDPLNFAWSQTAGPPVTLSNAASAAPTFNGVGGSTYTFQLVVDDCLNASPADTVVITVNAAASGGGGGGGGCGLLGIECLLMFLLLRKNR